MAEPTLGQRIAEAAARCIVAELDHGTGSPEAGDVWAELLALCDRADAAERLAQATLAMDAATDAWHDASPDDVEARRAYDDATMAYEAARYAWQQEVDGE